MLKSLPVVILALVPIHTAIAADTAEPEKVTFLVTGLHCPPCTKTVAGSLESLKGVKSAVVDWKTKTAAVQFDPAETTVWAMSQHVTETPHMMGGRLRYAAWLALNVPKLKDDAAGKTVKQALLQVKGVRDATTYPKQHVAAILFDREPEVTLEQITTALSDAGFPGETY